MRCGCRHKRKGPRRPTSHRALQLTSAGTTDRKRRRRCPKAPLAPATVGGEAQETQRGGRVQLRAARRRQQAVLGRPHPVTRHAQSENHRHASLLRGEAGRNGPSRNAQPTAMSTMHHEQHGSLRQKQGSDQWSPLPCGGRLLAVEPHQLSASGRRHRAAPQRGQAQRSVDQYGDGSMVWDGGRATCTRGQRCTSLKARAYSAGRSQSGTPTAGTNIWAVPVAPPLFRARRSPIVTTSLTPS